MKVDTIYGEMDDSILEKREGRDEDERAVCDWVEYWKEGVLVHRSATLAVKTLH